MVENKLFSWIPFYQELAEKLLEYKDKREELVQFVYSLGNCSNFIKKDDGSKVDDLDPYTCFAIFNRQIGDAKQVEIAKLFKDYFSIIAHVPDDFLGIPVMNNQKSVFFYRKTSSEQIPLLWNLFESELKDDTSKLVVAFDSLQKFHGIKWNLTIGMYWIRPYLYVPLDELSRKYLAKIGVDVFKETDLSGKNYMSLLDTIKKRIDNEEIKERHIPEISFNAWNSKKHTQYWLYAPGENAKYWDDFYNKGIIAIGWEELGDLSVFSKREDLKKAMGQIYGDKNKPNDLSCNDDFVNKMNIGDVVFVKKGRKKVLGYGIVTSDYYYDENRTFYKSLRNVDWKAKGEWEHPGKAVIKTLTDITSYTGYIEELKSLFTMNSEVQTVSNILRLKKNIILQGAPGTGKTYNTAALALAICGEQIPDDHSEVMRRYEELQKEGRVVFVTFHQSMDYEDFVEGIKPKTENGMVSYEVEDGIFKRISNKAQTKQGSDILDCIDKYIHSIEGYANKKLIPTITGRSSLYVWWNKGNSTLSTRSSISSSSKDPEYSPSPINIEKLKMQAVGEGMENNWPTYAQAIINAVKNEYRNELEDSDSTTPYVLIIDEINRGNVSKIFGELITLLEADKRIGGDHPIRVTLPYSKESFGVPSNLYIIGTMNTTDRSVGNIDYAVRRRFAFATLKAGRKLVEQNSIPEAVTLFDAVESFIKKHQIDMDFEDLMVGHSYFFAKGESELELKWQYEILPLLNEYIKDGIINAKPISSDLTIADFVGEWHPASAQ